VTRSSSLNRQQRPGAGALMAFSSKRISARRIYKRDQGLTISRQCTLACPALRREIVVRRGFFALVAGRKLLVNTGR
jgi:hypothetical protein